MMSTPRPRRDLFYLAMAILMIAIAIAGFAPALLQSAGRKGPPTPFVLFHGFLFALWLILFLAQAALVFGRRLAPHRTLGWAAAALAPLMVLTGVLVTIDMARRGYDLSGDLTDSSGSARSQIVFQLGDLVTFSLLFLAAFALRRRPPLHKRLMLFATLGGMMPAALVHMIGHSPSLRTIEAPIILIPLTILYFTPALHDRLVEGRFHPLSLWTAVALLLWANIRAALINPSEAWRSFIDWLSR